MVDKDKNKGSEFDDGFDDDFSDVNFDDISFEDNTSYDDMAGDDVGYEGDDFESDEWGEGEEETLPKNKKPKKSGGGLSFNTIVIIGAVVLGGGVLAFNVMRETEKAETAKPAGFQSILGIGGIMDGTLFGDKKESAATDETQTQDQGFLNNSDAQLPANTTPPQPAPIAPADGEVSANEPLTPMPDLPGEPSAEAPRGPNDAIPLNDGEIAANGSLSPETTNVAPVPTSADNDAQSAEDILKQAMANRDQKQQETQGSVPAVETEAPVPSEDDTLPDILDEKLSDVKEDAAEIAQEIKEDAEKIPSVIEDKLPLPAKEEKAPAPVTAPAAAADDEAVTALSEKLDMLLQRMDRIEEDLGTIREDRETNTAEIEKAVSAMKKDLAELKKRPVSTTAPAKEEIVSPKTEQVKKKVSKSAPVDDEVYTPSAQSKPVAPAPAPKTTTVSSSGWELRAAQPGRAWVSKPGERDMQAVSVGENLAGIGRITAITYENGRWVVTGTQSSIRQ